MTEPYERRYLKGPELVEWLMPWLDHENLHPTSKRALHRWRSGARACVYAVDELLVASTELSIWDIPEECWSSGSTHGRRYPAEVKNDAIKRVRDGEEVSTVASSLGADRETIKGWVEKGVAA